MFPRVLLTFKGFVTIVHRSATRGSTRRSKQYDVTKSGSTVIDARTSALLQVPPKYKIALKFSLLGKNADIGQIMHCT